MPASTRACWAVLFMAGWKSPNHSSTARKCQDKAGQQRFHEPARQDCLLKQRAVQHLRSGAGRFDLHLERPGLGLASPELLPRRHPDAGEGRGSRVHDKSRGLIPIRSRSSGSVPDTVAFTAALPRLSIARLCVAARLPVEVRGSSSVNVSANTATESVPSSTALPAGSSWEVARMPNTTGPAGTDARRGGANRTTARPSVPGKSDRVGGSTVSPGRRVAQDFDRELVDDGAGVSDRDRDGRHGARDDLGDLAWKLDDDCHCASKCRVPAVAREGAEGWIELPEGADLDRSTCPITAR